MTILAAILVVAVLLQLSLTYRWMQSLRPILAPLVLLLYAITGLGLLLVSYGIGSIGNLVVSLYSIVNVARAAYGRGKSEHQMQTIHRTGSWLVLLHMFLLYFMIAAEQWQTISLAYLYTLTLLQLAVAIFVFLSSRAQLKHTVGPRSTPSISDSRLPTVTVAIPVRNEGVLLQRCLETVVSSNYPKLEILAFDDHSRDKSPEIIRSFAHAGVRFLRSAEPQDGWLAKNLAYETLLQEANGEYVLFMGADVRMAPQSIRQIVQYAESRHKHMVSILPLNRKFKMIPILQAMRYYWELAPPRWFAKRPPVLSSCWLVHRTTLERNGGFAAVKQSITPEAIFARFFLLASDSYAFLRSNKLLGIYSEKSFKNQQSTARLRRYPQAHRRPEVVMALSVGQSLLLVGSPIMTILAALLQLGWLPVLASAAAFVLHVQAYAAIQSRVFPNAAPWRCYAAFLPSIVADVWYLNQSMILYEFANITWKDRNASDPVMRPHHLKH